MLDGQPFSPEAPTYRIPQGALLASLGGNYALGNELEEIDARKDGVTEDDVRAVLE